MELERLPQRLTICKIPSISDIPLDDELVFVGKTDEELSLVCKAESVPASATERNDGWRALRVKGTLDLSLKGILADLSGMLAAAEVGIFALSTFNTDYILVKEEDLARAKAALSNAGHSVR